MDHKHRSTYIFKTAELPNDELVYRPPSKISKFYQFCYFPDPKSKKYYVRMILTDENNNQKIFVKLCETAERNKLMESCKDNEYKLYNTWNFDQVDLPSKGEVQISQSDIFSHNTDYSGYAPFNY